MKILDFVKAGFGVYVGKLLGKLLFFVAALAVISLFLIVIVASWV